MKKFNEMPNKEKEMIDKIINVLKKQAIDRIENTSVEEIFESAYFQIFYNDLKLGLDYASAGFKQWENSMWIDMLNLQGGIKYEKRNNI